MSHRNDEQDRFKPSFFRITGNHQKFADLLEKWAKRQAGDDAEMPTDYQKFLHVLAHNKNNVQFFNPNLNEGEHDDRKPENRMKNIKTVKYVLLAEEELVVIVPSEKMIRVGAEEAKMAKNVAYGFPQTYDAVYGGTAPQALGTDAGMLKLFKARLADYCCNQCI